MKKDTHPKFNNDAEVSCACGNSFKIGSTLEKIEVEVCSACHPYFTGNEKILDSAGRVEKFKRRMAKATEKTSKTKTKTKKSDDKSKVEKTTSESKQDKK